MKTTKKHTTKRTVAMVLAAFTMMTATVPFCSVTMTASAAVGDNDFDFRGMGIAAVDAGFSDLAKMIPGGNILLSPFKSLFHGAVDKKSPMSIMSDKLNEIDGKLDEISVQVTELGKKMEDNIRYLESVSDLSEVKGYYQNMLPYVEKLKRKIYAIEGNANLSQQQKVVQLGALLEDPDFTQVWVNIFKIKNSMSSENTDVYTSMFDTLYKKAAANRMFSKEAYDDAKAVADNLSAQYLYSAGLLTECQVAFNAAISLEQEEVELLDSYDLASYNQLKRDEINLSSYDNDTLYAVAACIKGYEDFKKYDNYNFINKGSENRTWGLSYDEIYHSGQTEYSLDTMKSRQPEAIPHIKDVIAESKTSRFTYAEIKSIADYVKKNYPGTTLYDFLIDMGNPYIGPYYDGYRIYHAYIVVDGSISESSVYNAGASWGNKALGNKFYNITKNVTCIDLFDPELKTVKVEVGSYYTCEEWLTGICLKTHIQQYSHYTAPSNIFVHFNET